MSKADEAYAVILDRIGTGEIRQADVISHRQLADELGMSKLPVSSALKRLEAEGLVESLPRVGTRVRRISPAHAWGMIQWRVAIETQCAGLAAEWMTDAERKDLLKAGAAMDVFMKEHDSPAERAGREREFHLLIAKMSHCKRLEQELQRLEVFHLKLRLCEAVNLVATVKAPRTSPNHRGLVKAIAAGDPDEAEVQMRRHIEGSRAIAGFMEAYRKQAGPPP